MYVRHVIYLRPTPEQMLLVRELWHKLGWGEPGSWMFGYTLKLKENTLELQVVREFLEETNIRHRFVRTEYVYSERELRSYQLLRLAPTSYAGEGADTYGTEFDKSTACPACGTGWRQVSPLVINKREMGKKDIAVTYEHEYVISGRIAQALKAAGCTGYELRPVKHYSSRPGKHTQMEVYQLIATNLLPPMREPPTVFERSKEHCEVCGRRGLFIRSNHYYERESLQQLCDFNATAEYFGEGPFPRQRVIVTQKVYRLLKCRGPWAHSDQPTGHLPRVGHQGRLVANHAHHPS